MKRKIPKERIITRSFHCPKCEKTQSPKLGDNFVTYGGTGRLKLHEYEGGGILGITPHFIRKDSETSEQVVISVSCTIHECGVDIFHDNDFNEFEFDIIESRTYKVSKGDWVALQNFKDNDYRI